MFGGAIPVIPVNRKDGRTSGPADPPTWTGSASVLVRFFHALWRAAGKMHSINIFWRTTHASHGMERGAGARQRHHGRDSSRIHRPAKSSGGRCRRRHVAGPGRIYFPYARAFRAGATVDGTNGFSA